MNQRLHQGQRGNQYKVNFIRFRLVALMQKAFH